MTTDSTTATENWDAPATAGAALTGSAAWLQVNSRDRERIEKLRRRADDPYRRLPRLRPR